MISLEPVAAPPESLRRACLAALPQPQELYVEDRVGRGECVLLTEAGEGLGYGVVHDRRLVEFWCKPAHLRRIGKLFAALAGSGRLDGLLCKSFDDQMMFLGLGLRTAGRTVGLLYRNVVDPGFAPAPAISVREASLHELPVAREVDPSFFADDAVTAQLIGERGLFFYETTDGGLLGCGLLKRVIPWLGDFDLGMAVAPAHRGHGYGAYIIGHLKALCLASGKRPICGHAVANVASQRSLERAGFAATHRLADFDLT